MKKTSTRVAVLLPGKQLGPHVPLLTYAGRAAESRGARLVPLTWNPPEVEDLSTLGPWVRDQVEPVLDRIGAAVPDADVLLIGKSLGTQAAAVAAERSLPAIWLTPLLHHDWVTGALRRATAPRLLVGGAADRTWNGDLARRLSPHTLQVVGADHGMFVPGPLTSSAAVLGQVATAVEHFLDNVVWM